ncbi:MAG: SEC-C motif-containing protein [Myxococcota bacterium]|jgi:SEC-C motif-containing protein
MRCRCHSRKLEKRCCGRFHTGSTAPTPELLMRSRYAAYAKGLTGYIQQTTDPSGPHFYEDDGAWTDSLTRFCQGTRFTGLDILDAPEPIGDTATVRFHAYLEQGEQDASFIENSVFHRKHDRWLYHSAVP